MGLPIFSRNNFELFVIVQNEEREFVFYGTVNITMAKIVYKIDDNREHPPKKWNMKLKNIYIYVKRIN